MRWSWLLLLPIAFGAWQAWAGRAVHHPPGVIAEADPAQEPLAQPLFFEREGYRFEARARFSAKARVLGTERYRFDRMADFSPVDFALGWGRMSDSARLDQLSLSQAQRFYFWRVVSFPLPRAEIVAHSANMHMIPADGAVKRELLRARPGQLVRFSGYLVDVTGRDGISMKTSLSRTDTGPGSCEIVWVESLELESQ
jgi:hypothetical protein